MPKPNLNGSRPAGNNYKDDTQPDVEQTLEGISDLIVKIGTTIPKILHWLTKGGAPIVAGLFGVYAFAICVESYYLALPVLTLTLNNPGQSLQDGWQNQWAEVSTNRPFIPKPGINDGASLGNLGAAMASPDFWVCVLVALSVQVIESFVQRGKDPDLAKLELDEVKHHTSPKLPDGAIALVHQKKAEYEDAGMDKVRRNSRLVWLAYGVDWGAALSTFMQHAFKSPAAFGLSAVWCWVAIYGPETLLGWMEDRLEEYEWFKSGRRKLRVPQRPQTRTNNNQFKNNGNGNGRNSKRPQPPKKNTTGNNGKPTLN